MARPLNIFAYWFAAICIVTVGISYSSSFMKTRSLMWRVIFGVQDPKSKAPQRLEGSKSIDFLTLDKHDNVANLRILTMGASRTFGATLEHRLQSAYPFLLSRNATNLAIRATGPDYPSLCAYSMIGESAQFDAIVLEFYVDADDYLIILARRLRRRFPKAAIVLLRIWGPLQFIYLPTDTAQGLRTFLDRHSLSIHDEDFMDVLRTEANQDDWFFNPYSRQLEVQRKVISDVGAILWELERPVDPFEALEQYRAFFAEDLVHISKAGHEMIADRLITVLAQVQKSDETGTWEHDFCQSWFESGKIELQSHEEVVMTEFDTKSHKWALEFNPTVAWMKAQNPLGRTSQVFVRYMKTSPPPGLYPTTMVQIEGGNVGEEVIINPTGSNSFSRSHINQVAKIGYIPPGEMKLVFTALEKGKKFPFRVTGIVIAPFDNELLQS